MKVFVGLGNPGEKYRNTRHNVGFGVVDKLQAEISKSKFLISPAEQGLALPDNENPNFQFLKKFNAEIWEGNGVVLAKPQTFMNRSGEAVRKLMANGKWQMDDLYVVHDDLDIPLGKYKIQLGKGPKVHNGLQSIYKALGTKEFWHVRVGIDNRGGVLRLSGLSPFDKAQGRHKSRRAQDDTAALKSLAAVSSGEEYVLGRFLPEERKVIGEVIEKVVRDLIKLIEIDRQ